MKESELEICHDCMDNIVKPCRLVSDFEIKEEVYLCDKHFDESEVTRCDGCGDYTRYAPYEYCYICEDEV